MQYIVTTYSRRVFDNDVDAPQIVGMHPGASENQPYPFFFRRADAPGCIPTSVWLYTYIYKAAPR